MGEWGQGYVTTIIGLPGISLAGGYDTGWIAVPMLAAGQNHPDFPVHIRRVGVVVKLRGSMRNVSSSGTFENWAQIPAGKAFFPSMQLDDAIAVAQAAGQYAARVSTAGVISVWSSAASGGWRNMDGLSWFVD